jgi:glyoxylase-like metal-dependent hydrolase (beta-lactamase superfamily II)
MNLDNLFCLDLDLPTMEGFRKFISSWCYRDDKFTLVVDPGPLSTIPHLVSELRRRGVERVDYVLLTHIHIDHAGGTGALLREFPEARAICHPEGVCHLVDPEKLWQGSRKVLGNMAEAYGEIVPIPAARIGYEEVIGDNGVRVFLTPGHAQHHVSYLLDDLLFGGEVVGVRGEVAQGIYMRPATPPRFILDVALDSIDRMIALAPRILVFGHYGLVENALEHLQIGRRQLRLWLRGVASTVGLKASWREEAIYQWLLEQDEVFRNIRQLPADIYQRERFFLGNTFRGMIEYVDGLSPDERQTLAAGE